MAKENKQPPNQITSPHKMAIGCIAVIILFLFALNTLINFFLMPLVEKLPW